MLGITLDGKKDIIGIWIGENETSKYWLTLLNELKNRGVEDVLIFAIDGLNGFNQAIQAVYPCACTLCEKSRNTKMYSSSNKKFTSLCVLER